MEKNVHVPGKNVLKVSDNVKKRTANWKGNKKKAVSHSKKWETAETGSVAEKELSFRGDRASYFPLMSTSAI